MSGSEFFAVDMPAMSNMAKRKQGSQKRIILLEGGAINDVQARAIYTQTDCWCIIRPLRPSRQKSGKYPVIARELAIVGPVDKWDEAEMLVREQVKRTAKPEQPNLRQTKRLRGPG